MSRDLEDVRLNLRGLDAVERQQLRPATLAAAEGIAEAVTKASGHPYRAVESGSRRFPRAAVFPVGIHAKRSENKHHWLNKAMP